jgi:DNA-binding transcriptional ArsR family regulator
VIKHPTTFDEQNLRQPPDLAQIRAALPPEEEIQMMARIFKALSDPTRSRLILTLIQQELCVNDIASVIGASPSAVSHHLQGLRDISLVKYRREGNLTYYSIDDAHVANLFREAVYHLDHVRRNLPDHQGHQHKGLPGDN